MHKMRFNDVFKLVRVVACDPVAFRDGKVLLVRRSINPCKGYWCLPGGIMDLGETCERCAERELFEETGFRGKAQRLVKVYSSPKRDKRQTVGIVFLVKITGGRARLSDETDRVEFFSPSKLPSKMAFDHGRVVRDAVKALSLRRS